MSFPPSFAVKIWNNSLERSPVSFKLLNAKGMRYRQRPTQAGDYISNLIVILFRHFDWQSCDNYIGERQTAYQIT